MPTVLATDTPWVIVPAIVLGGCFYIAVDMLVGLAASRMATASASGPFLIYFSVAVDLGLSLNSRGSSRTVGLASNKRPLG